MNTGKSIPAMDWKLIDASHPGQWEHFCSLETILKPLLRFCASRGIN